MKFEQLVALITATPGRCSVTALIDDINMVPYTQLTVTAVVFCCSHEARISLRMSMPFSRPPCIYVAERIFAENPLQATVTVAELMIPDSLPKDANWNYRRGLEGGQQSADLCS